MAIRITDLTNYTTPANNDVIPIVDVANGITKKVTRTNFFSNPPLANSSITSDMLVEAFAKGRRQDDNSNTISDSTKSGLLIQYGWCQIIGNATRDIRQNITFDTAFSEKPVILTGNMAALASAYGTDIAGLTGFDSTSNSASPVSHSTTGFTMVLRKESGGTFSATTYYGASWIAIGTV